MPSAEDIEFDGRPAVLLRADGGAEAVVDPGSGLNVSRLSADGRDLIRYDPVRRSEGRTYAVPILYPTPNRVRCGRFSFGGSEYSASMHGVAYRSPFSVADRGVSGSSAFLTGELDFAPGTPAFGRFPWNSVLSVTVALSPGKIRWSYRVRNRDRKPLPYGFALHPFFLRHGRTVLSVSASAVMESDAEKLPTGRIIPVAGTRFDLRSGADASGIDLDEVYFDEAPIVSNIDYPDIGLSLTLTASPEFTHVVAYSPAGRDFLCVENQTCSTDAHNLAAAGRAREANLLEVPPGEEREGWVEARFRISSIDET